jgi:hypothetical protein
MGRQIMFYLSGRDYIELENELLGVDGTVILSHRFSGPFPECSKSIDVIDNGQRIYFFYLALKSDLNLIITREVPTQGYWTVDDLRSSVIELSRGRVEQDLITRGRLYYNESYFDGDGKSVKKNADYLAWSKRVLAKVRRSLTYDQEHLAYVGRDAGELSRGGVKLIQF